MDLWTEDNMALALSRSRKQLSFLLGTSFLLSACAIAPGITPQEADMRDQISVDRFMPATREMRDNIETQELFAQAAFWSHEYDLNPSDLEATIKLAAAVRKLGNPSRAVEITQTSRAIHPRDPYLLAEHAAGLIADERALDAIPVLDQGLSLTPGYGRLWSLKGAALDQMEEYEAARMNYSRALQITPNDPNVLANLGLSHALSGDLQTSEGWLRRAVAMPSAGPGVRQNLALVLQLQGRTEDAERELRRARLTRGDNRLPPDPVPALTPRGVPAQMSSQDPSGYQGQSGYQAQPSYQARPQAQTGYQGQSQNRTQVQSQPQMRQRPQAQGQAFTRGGMPATRLTTTTPDGRAFNSASEAARAIARRRGRNRGQTQQPTRAPSAIQPNYQNSPMTPEQQSVMQDIQRSLQPGAVGPQAPAYNQALGQVQGQVQAPSQPQPHVVGPALRTQSNPYQATPYQAPASQAPTPQGTTDYSGLAGSPEEGRAPARRRR